MIHPVQQVQIINQQIHDWEASKFATGLQLKTHKHLVELGVGNSQTLSQLEQQLTAAIAAIDFLQDQLKAVFQPLTTSNGEVVLDDANKAQ